MKRLLCLGALAWGCTSTVMEASHFEKECLTPGQCRPVTFGDVCTPCTCLNGAVNEQGFGKYELERKSISCAPTGVQCSPCPQPSVDCVDAGCVLQ